MTEITKDVICEEIVCFSWLVHTHSQEADDELDVRANIIKITELHYLRR